MMHGQKNIKTHENNTKNRTSHYAFASAPQCFISLTRSFMFYVRTLAVLHIHVTVHRNRSF